MKRSLAMSTPLIAVLLTGAVGAGPAPEGRQTNRLPHLDANAVLTGRFAREWVADLRLKRPRFVEAQARSEARLRGRGYKPTETVVVYAVGTRNPVRASSAWEGLVGFFAPTLVAQSQQSSEGYAIFTSWDDSNKATWEGNMYFIDGEEDLDTSIDGQLDISQDQPPPVLWASGEMTGHDQPPYPIDFELELSPGKLILANVGIDVSAAKTAQSPCKCGTPYLAKCLI